MNKSGIIFLLLIFIGICSCKKDSLYPIIYTSYSISEPTIKVYSKDGEVNSPEIKDALVKRYKTYLLDLEKRRIDGRIVVTYLSENSVRISRDNKKENKRRAVHTVDELIYWEIYDIVESPFSSDLRGDGYFKYSPPYYEEFREQKLLVTLTYCKYKPCSYAIKDGEEIKIPMLDLIIKDDYRLNGYSSVNNALNADNLPDFQFNDTIIAREYFYKLKQ